MALHISSGPLKTCVGRSQYHNKNPVPTSLLGWLNHTVIEGWLSSLDVPVCII